MPTRRKLADAIRVLSMDAVQAANSGHPGMPMGMADLAEVLWNDFVRHNPTDPAWVNRDRVVVSNGHGSMLPYSVLHLTGYELALDDLKNFRQMHSKTPGHPEYGETPGIETTTGPLGQGIANAIGMALAEKTLAQQFNRDDHQIVDHHTYVLLGDGCLMEGVSHEACSLAGTHKLGKLICLYDDNDISIDGNISGWFTDDTSKRFESYGWQVIGPIDGHDSSAVKAAIEQAQANQDQPTLIRCKTVIGYGSPNKQGTSSTHGAPLGHDEIEAVRQTLGWDLPPFEIPEDIYAGWNAHERGQSNQTNWDQQYAEYASAYPDLAIEFERRTQTQLPENWAKQTSEIIEDIQSAGPEVASRKASQMALNSFGPLLPELIGGSADLAGSNNTIWDQSKDILDGEGGNYIYFGVREFGMAAICNGIGLHGGFIPYSATFLVFSDYSRNALRMSALIPVGAIHVFTHDSIGLGEDGPTHQPIEHLASLRVIPNMDLWRPCDAVESAVAWKAAIERRDAPTSLVFTRQGLPHQFRDKTQLANIEKGGYVLLDSQTENIDAIIIATGSEVGLAMNAARSLNEQGVGVRVVSMPNTDLFDRQSLAYRESVLPGHVRNRVAVEAATPDYWRKYVGLDGAVIGMDRFGASAPANELFEAFGFTVDNIVASVKSLTGTA